MLSLLELKRGNAEAMELTAQLQGGANIANGFIPLEHEVRFVAIAVYGGRLHRAERERLKGPGCKVTFRGTRYEIQLLRCGSPLNNAIM